MVLHQNKSSKNYIYGKSKQTYYLKTLWYSEKAILSTELVMILAGILPFHFDLFGQVSTHNTALNLIFLISKWFCYFSFWMLQKLSELNHPG